MHPTLIKANIALLEGLPSEAQRYLQEYRSEDAANPDPDLALTLWIDAHSRTRAAGAPAKAVPSSRT